jgi:anthranilate synthase component 1
MISDSPNTENLSAPKLVDVTDQVCVDAPLALYEALRDMRYPYLLESVEKSGQRARFSFLGADPSAVVTIKNRQIALDFYEQPVESAEFIAERVSHCCDVSMHNSKLTGKIRDGFDIFDALRCAIPCSASGSSEFERQVFLGGGIGYLAYDLVKDLLGVRSESSAPDAQFAIVENTFVFDHLTGKVYLSHAPVLPGEHDKSSLMELVENIDPSDDITEADYGILGGEIAFQGDPEEFEESVRVAKEHILAGDIFQVVLARIAKIRLKNPDPLILYRKLRDINPSPYTYIFEFGDLSVVGASPETLFSTYKRQLTVNPIAGTCPRGKTPEEDEILARKMLDDEKEQAEHVMLVDLGRNDVRRVSRSGTVLVEDFMSVLKYSHVQHIETTVRGTLRDECDQFDAARATFPAGTLSGAPKLRAMEIINSLEPEPRGIYGGGVGYFSFDGGADFAIAIRSVVMQDDYAFVQAGAGIVADSNPHNEYLETERKMAPMKKALEVKY